MTVLNEEMNIKLCQVHNCIGMAEYRNESSKLVYCFDCADKHNFKIFLDKEHRQFAKLVKIPVKDFDINDLIV